MNSCNMHAKRPQSMHVTCMYMSMQPARNIRSKHRMLLPGVCIFTSHSSHDEYVATVLEHTSISGVAIVQMGNLYSP